MSMVRLIWLQWRLTVFILPSDSVATGVNLIVLVQSIFRGGRQVSRRVSLIAGTRDKEEKKIQEKGNVAAAKHLEVAFFTLSVFPLFFSSPHVIVFCINPFTSLRASRRLVCFFFFTFFNPHLKKKSTCWKILALFAYFRARFITNLKEILISLIRTAKWLWKNCFFISKGEMMKANPLSSGLVILLLCLHCGAFSRFASFGIASALKGFLARVVMETQHV